MHVPVPCTSRDKVSDHAISRLHSARIHLGLVPIPPLRADGTSRAAPSSCSLQTERLPSEASATDRLLWVWLSRLWPGWQAVLEFAQPRTVIAWQKKRCRTYWRRLSQSGKPGRPAIVKEVRKLIQDMWQSHPTWGSPRIVGELRKLGIDVAKATVEKYRPKVRKPSSPTWKAFLNNHVQDLVACDVFTVQPSPARDSSCSSSWHTSAAASCMSTAPNIQQPVDRPADRRGVSLRYRPTVPAARPRLALQCAFSTSHQEHGPRRRENCTTPSMAAGPVSRPRHWRSPSPL